MIKDGEISVAVNGAKYKISTEDDDEAFVDRD